MNGIKTSLLRGLNAWQIKVIAVIAMTVDHLAAYGFEIPLFDAYYDRLRLIGRIAMPLFLFLLTDSIRYTRSRPKFLLRLYLAGLAFSAFCFYKKIQQLKKAAAVLIPKIIDCRYRVPLNTF